MCQISIEHGQRVGGWRSGLRALRLEAKRNETEKGRNGETAKKKNSIQKAAIKLGNRK